MQLVRFSDKTMQGLAADNSDLREQLERLRGQLVEARKAAKSTQSRDDGPSKGGTKVEEGKEAGDGSDPREDASSEAGKLDMYKAQLKDLNRRVAKLQEVCIYMGEIHTSHAFAVSRVHHGCPLLTGEQAATTKDAADFKEYRSRGRR